MCECSYCMNDECKVKMGWYLEKVRIHFYSNFHSLYSEYIDIFVDPDYVKAISESISFSNRVEYVEINPDDLDYDN